MAKKTNKKSFSLTLRNYFIAGVVVLIPIGFTLYLTKILIGISSNLIPKNIKLVLLRTIFNVIAMILYFGVIPMMPIAEAGAGLFTSPIFVLLFSFLFFGEKKKERTKKNENISCHRY